MLKHLSEIALFGALFLSVINIIAAVFGLGPAAAAAFGIKVPMLISAAFALLGAGTLVYSWVNSFMSNRAGLALYFCNLLVAPFGYMLLGLPMAVAVLIAVSPIPFYQGVGRLSDLLKPKDD